MRKQCLRTVHVLMASLIVAAPLFWFESALASPLGGRSVRLGSSLARANTSHVFNFTIPSVSSIGSIEFEYCSDTPFVGASCVPPTGFSASAATLVAQTGETGFSIDPASTVNRIVLSRPAGLTSAVAASYSFGGIVNQNTPNSTAYVRIATFASSDGTGPRTDEGAVAYSTAGAISVSGYVPPYLTFCVGVVVSLDCSSSTGSQLNFGELVTNQPRFLSSQFSVATNDPGGYVTSVLGTTMTSGSNTIPALASPQPSQSGVSQFGINLLANSNPSIGANPVGVGTASIAPNFANSNQFFFDNQVVASSLTTTNFNTFTVSYIVNINGDQKPGVYTTTLTYVASAAF